MNILVTGGCGFIGSNFIHQRLLERESSIRVLVNLDKLTYAGNLANLERFNDDARYVFAHGDIGDEVLVDFLLREYEIDAVVNLAAESHVDRSIDSPEPFIETNVMGTLRLLNSVKRHWEALEGGQKDRFRILHVSTDEVFGTLLPGEPAFREETSFSPNSPYAASKASSDHLVRAYHHTYGLPTLTTNCSNNYGPYHFPEKLIPLVILNALDGEFLPIYGDGRQIRDWLYVEDHAAAIWTVLRNGQVGRTYNIGGLNERENIAVVRTICSLLDMKHPRTDGRSYLDQITYVADRPGHDRRYAIDCSRIRDELGWYPRESFDSGMELTVNWYLSNFSWARERIAMRYDRKRLGCRE